MHILLTNDDGFSSPGFKAAYDALTGAGHKVTAVAPDRERSGQSHSVTFYSHLNVTDVGMPDGATGYIVSGTPADCAHIGCIALAKKPIDLVVSGINTDTNLGYDANYSGTVSAALEAASLGHPALASSLERSDDCDWAGAGRITMEAAELHGGWDIPIGVIVNLNIPARIAEPDWIWAPLNLIAVSEHYRIDADQNGDVLYRRTRMEAESPYQAGSDVDFFRRGRVTLSPLGPVRTERVTLARLQNQALGAQTGPEGEVSKRAQKSF
jgi:5'-nucleotidase